MDTAEEIFAVAKALPAGKRAAYLDEACEDAEMRERVEDLLRGSEEAGDFFAEFEEVTQLNDPAEGPGSIIGNYKLLQKIGEGGFGVVFMAEQHEPIVRRVALKVIRAGMDTDQVLARFEAERQALAAMQHPNIASFLDAGATESGRPYVVMELVKGIPITEICRERKLSLRARLALFRDVCAAVNHAHQKGIIHRDLKPSNVLVTLIDDQPVPKVIDFGIAKATHSKLTERTLWTRFEQFLGTPAYISPEQAALSGVDADTRADIYSLGVLLYELLAGTPPFHAKTLASAGFDEMRRIIREEDPPNPSTKLTQTRASESTEPSDSQISPHALRGELDWIVMKAIDKERSRRYETANAFAADIGRFLDDVPVLAAAPSALYRFRKFARRNKTAFAVAAAMVMLLLAGITTTGWQALRATSEKESAHAERDRAVEAERRAAESLALVTAERDAKDAALQDAEAISEFLTGMIERAQPGQENGGSEVKLVKILDDAVRQLNEDEAIPAARRAKLQQTFGSAYYSLGLHRQAIPLTEALADYRLTTLGPVHPDTLTARIDLSISYHDVGRRHEALEIREEVLELYRKSVGREHPDTLWAMNALAVSYDALDRLNEALRLREEALETSRKTLGPDHPDTLLAMIFLAKSYRNLDRPNKALEITEGALQLSREICGPEHPRTLWAMENHADSYHNLGHRDEALKMREEWLKLSSKVLGPEHSHTLVAMEKLARSYHDIGRRDEALQMREELLELRRKVLGAEHPETTKAAEQLRLARDSTGSKDNDSE